MSTLKYPTFDSLYKLIRLFLNYFQIFSLKPSCLRLDKNGPASGTRIRKNFTPASTPVVASITQLVLIGDATVNTSIRDEHVSYETISCCDNGPVDSLVRASVAEPAELTGVGRIKKIIPVTLHVI